MGAFEFLVTVKTIGGAERALLPFVEDDLDVDKLSFFQVDIRVGAEKLFRKQGDVKLVRITKEAVDGTEKPILETA